MSYLSIRSLCLSYQQGKKITPALDQINLELEQGDICALVGPSGGGKSSLLGVLSGSLKPTSGEVLLGGKPLDSKEMQIALVPQSYGLLPWKTLGDNIRLPRALGRRSLGDAELADIISSLGIEALLHRYPHEVSGGQRQRAALARAFGMQPDLLLLDEPFSALDIVRAEQSQKLFLDLWQRYPCTTLLVSHKTSEALELGTRIAILSEQGRLSEINPKPSERELGELLRRAYRHALD